MENQKFDRLARALATHLSRRAGILGTIGAVAGLGVAGEVDADRKGSRRHEKLACRNAGSECTSGDQCCSGNCVSKLGGVGFRCARGRGKKKDNKKKGGGGGGGGGGGLIPNGEPCVVNVSACADPLATCTTYFDGAPTGTHCLVANGAACSASTDCRSNDCNGTCTAQVCDVCLLTCTHTTVQSAMNAASSGATIRIGAGTYTEDLATTLTSLTLSNCNGSEVYLQNATTGTRTITAGNETTYNNNVNALLVLRSVTVKRNANFQYGGGVYGYTSLEMRGSAAIRDSNIQDYGGGAYLMYFQDTSNYRTLKMYDDSTIAGNLGQNGGGVYMYDSHIELHDNSSIDQNQATSGEGGGIYQSGYNTTVKLFGHAKVTRNTSTSNAGGIRLGGGSDDHLHFEMHDFSEVSYNTVSNGDGGGVLGGGANWLLDGDSSIHHNNSTQGSGGGAKESSGATIEMKDRASMHHNTCQYDGGAFYGSRNSNSLILYNDASIYDNTAARGGGVYDTNVELNDNATITNNTPNNCEHTDHPDGQCTG